jgi:hypothetical protein
MSRNELTRLRVLIDVADGRLSVADATGLIGVGRRQIYRLLQAFRADGADGLISRKRGGPSNRALGSVFRETVLAIVCERCRFWPDSGGREPVGASWPGSRGRDVAAMDDRRRPLGSAERPANPSYSLGRFGEAAVLA